ncbi:MAG TPA: trypsin-like peptidase domain-containing protein [Gemmataceae bacterium]|nr:trypsin-like peptidase domain-containing protein [Pirellulales bacterium]HZZ82031.1 trypsin-like peptidase domain-containing protein [Gemmataceae bacterium]
MLSRHRLLALALFCCGLSVGGAFVYAVGRALETEEPLSADQRVELYRSLNQQVDALESQFNVVKTVVQLVSPTVVHIKAEKPDHSTRRSQRELIEEAGSGVIIEFKGRFFVLTNRHVIKDAQLKDIQISLSDGSDLRPLKVWSDADTDVALMAVSASGLTAARLGDSSSVEIGDYVLAVGSPFGLSHSVTYGIISAKGRRDLELGDAVELQDFMQTDAAINPGNSGGPLINLRGEVIGINTAIASNSGGNEGIGFSIPINGVMHIVRQFVEKGRVVRAFLGVSLDQRFTSTVAAKMGLRRRQGAHVTAVTDRGPAQAIGLQRGDVILKFNGIRVENDTHLIYLVSLTEVGKEVPLEVFRNGQVMHVNVKVGNKTDFPPQR